MNNYEKLLNEINEYLNKMIYCLSDNKPDLANNVLVYTDFQIFF